MNQYQKSEAAFWATIVGVIVGCLFAVVLVIGGAMWGLPKYKLYKADHEKQTLTITAKAKSQAAEYTAKTEVTKANYEAERDRIRAQGVADSNRLIADSLTEEYITWHYIDQMSRHSNQIIYVPTEGGVPIMEANRLKP